MVSELFLIWYLQVSISYMTQNKVAIIGRGQFGLFMSRHLDTHCNVVLIGRDSDPSDISICDVVIFAVPFEALHDAAKRYKKFVHPKAIVVDVCSVKQKPIVVLTKHFPKHQILGTHPVFGPQSGKNGISGLPIVLCNVSCTKRTYQKIVTFLKEILLLSIIEETPKQHDHEMANVQALTHFIGRGLLHMNIKSYATNTQSYQHLIELTKLLQFDSWELFTTIQLANPEAKIVRKKLLKSLQSLEQDLLKANVK